MTNAPERICIRPTHPHHDNLDWYVWSDGVAYTRDDLSAAQVAAAYEAAATCAFNADFAAQGHHGLALEISALTPADARAALDGIVAEAVAKERAAKVKVKPLVWRPWDMGLACAESAFGTYYVWEGHWRRSGWLGQASPDPHAAAQADHEARVRAELEE